MTVALVPCTSPRGRDPGQLAIIGFADPIEDKTNESGTLHGTVQLCGTVQLQRTMVWFRRMLDEVLAKDREHQRD